jgi:hypothetical protein
MIKTLIKPKKGELLIACSGCKSVIVYERSDIEKKPIQNYSGQITGHEKFVICPECKISINTKFRLW